MAKLVEFRCPPEEMQSPTVWINPDHVGYLWTLPERPGWTMIAPAHRVTVVVDKFGRDTSPGASIPVLEAIEDVARRLNGGI